MRVKIISVFYIVLLFIFSSCSEDLTPDLMEEDVEFELSKLPKMVNGEIAREFPKDVYFQLIKDLKVQDKEEVVYLLENCFVESEENYILKEEHLSQIPQTRADQNAFTYRAHCEDHGWMSYMKLGQIAGTMGEGRRMEALSFSYPNYTTAFKVRVHVQGKGWLAWVGLGDIAGTMQERRHIEAVQLNVSSSFATNVYYKVYMEKTGWGELVSNNNIAGTTGQNRRAEAFQLFMYIV